MKIDRIEVCRTIGFLGAALILAGWVRYTVQETMTPVSKWFMISGAVLLVLALGAGIREVIAAFRTRSGRLSTNAAFLGLGVILILGLLNFLGVRHVKRFDWTEEKLYTLSDQTKKVVSGLNKDVRVIRFDKPQGRDALRDRIEEYRRLNRRVSFETVDPQERPDVAKQFAVRRMGELVVSSSGRIEHLDAEDEQALTNAILKVTREVAKVVCFVEGHGEKSISASEATGFSGVEKALQGENYKTQAINLVESKQVPAECTVVVVAGPRTSFFPQETEMLTHYLDGGGKAMLLLDPQTDPKLDALLASWNIALGNNVALDVSGMGQMIGAGPAVPLVVHYGEHAVTQGLERQMTFFPLARTVKTADQKNAEERVTELLFTSPQSYAKNNLNPKEKEVRFEEGKDDKGPLSLGAAAQKSLEGKSARLVVIGNSNFAANAYFGIQRNGDLFQNAVNWLALDEDLISIRPKAPANRRVTLSVAQQNMFFWFSVVVMPGIVLFSGLALWWKRR